MLQETTGIGLNGAILISPALEFAPLTATDYDVLPWIDKLPTKAAAAVHHGRSRAFETHTPLDEVLSVAEEFATGEYVSFLTRGASLDRADSNRILTRLADLLGLPLSLVSRSEGRVSMHVFTRELLRDERKVLGLYDTTISTADPYPDRDPFGGPEPTLAGFGAAYTGAINQLLRSEIGIDTTRFNVDLERGMAHTQRGMSMFFDIQLRTAHPATQELEQLLSRYGHVAWQHRAQDRRVDIHLVVEPIHQRGHFGFAADLVIWGRSLTPEMLSGRRFRDLHARPAYRSSGSDGRASRASSNGPGSPSTSNSGCTT